MAFCHNFKLNNNNKMIKKIRNYLIYLIEKTVHSFGEYGDIPYDLFIEFKDVLEKEKIDNDEFLNRFFE
jgi:hypothetical protein